MGTRTTAWGFNRHITKWAREVSFQDWKQLWAWPIFRPAKVYTHQQGRGETYVLPGGRTGIHQSYSSTGAIATDTRPPWEQSPDDPRWAWPHTNRPWRERWKFYQEAASPYIPEVGIKLYYGREDEIINYMKQYAPKTMARFESVLPEVHDPRVMAEIMDQQYTTYGFLCQRVNNPQTCPTPQFDKGKVYFRTDKNHTNAAASSP